MRRLLLAVFLIVACCPLIHGQTQTSVTGLVSTTTGIPATSGYVEFRLRPSSSSIAFRVAGTSILAPTTARCSINSSGNIVALLGSGSCLVWGNTAITPASTCYDIVLAPANSAVATIQSQLITGASYDVSTPSFCPQVQLVPQYQSITTAPISANLVPAANKVFNLGDSNHYYGQAWIDVLTVNSLVNPGINSLTIGTINNIVFCGTTGTMGAASKTAAAALPSTGGTVDCRNRQGAQTIDQDPFLGLTNITWMIGGVTAAATVTVNVTTGSSIVGLGAVSIISPSSATVPTGELIRLQGDHATLSKVHLKGTGQGSGATVNGRRGVWVGCGTSQTAGCVESYAIIEDSEIENFATANGVAGDMQYAKIVNNDIHHNTDANVFFQPLSQYNLVQGNNIYNSRYSGIDINGSNNRIVNNDIHHNGGGSLDANSQEGIVITYVSTDTTQPNANLNLVEGNYIHNNVQAGVYVYVGGTTSGITNSPYGTLIKGNIVTGHTNAYNQNAGVTLNSWNGGIVVIGGNDTTVEGNTSCGNTYNYVVVGVSNNTSQGDIVSGNQSCNALTNAAMTGLGMPSGVGYFFPGSARIDVAGGSPATDVILTNNWDRFPAKESFRWSLDGAASLNWSGWTVSGNHSDTAGTYAYNMATPANLVNFFFAETNYSINAVTAAYNGFATNNGSGLTANSATPSVANTGVWFTQNSLATAYTNFTGAAPGAVRLIRVADANSTFNFSGTNLKGNFSTNYAAVSGDSLLCTFDGTNWQCTINHPGPATVFANTNQATNKSTNVTQNGVLSGRVTLHQGDGTGADQIAAGATKSFSILNTSFTTGRDFVLTMITGGPNSYDYTVTAADNGAGNILITVRNNSAGLLDDAIVLDYEIRKR